MTKPARGWREDEPRLHEAAHQVAASTLLLDIEAARVASRLDEAGVPVVVLRGPAIRDALYPGGARAYVDIDLLVPFDRELDAWGIVEGLGYRHLYDGVALSRRLAVAVSRKKGGRRGRYVSSWHKPGTALNLELHTSLVGIGRHPANAWEPLTRDLLPLDLPGGTARALGPAALAFSVALHAAQHGPGDDGHLEDLRRALRALDAEAWASAAVLADELDARAAFDDGVALVPWGRDLLRVDGGATGGGGHPDDVPVRPRLRDLLLLAPSVLWPTVALQRHDSRLARRGSLGLALSYAERLGWRADRVLRILAGPLRGALRPVRTPTLARLGGMAHPSTLRAVVWAFRQSRSGRAQLRAGDSRGRLRIEPAPVSPHAAERLIQSAVWRSGASCLVRATVLQEWHAANGRFRDVVIGVSRPGSDFGAHAWLDGDDYDADRYSVIERRPPRPR